MEALLVMQLTFIHASVFTVRVNVINATVYFAAPARVPPAYLKLLLYHSFFSEHRLMPLNNPIKYKKCLDSLVPA
jgi:hypothetical protein